jgi:alanine racemase
MSRPARALLDPEALRHNFARVRACAPQARVMAVVKADAYGHGLAWVASVLGEADAFGVASVEEGLTLRAAGVVRPVCLLEGFYEEGELALLAEHDLETVVHCEEQLRMLETARLARPLTVWLKVDSGMHRLGFAPENAERALARLRDCAAVGEIRLLSHLCCADDKKNPATRRQLERFLPLVRASRLPASLANSAGVLAWPQTHLDWVRPGLMLYGASPLARERAAELDLRPVMTLETALIAVQRRRRGERIGYGGDFECPEDMLVGVAAIGYGDGYPRSARPGTPVLVNDKRVPLIGRVSMDMVTLDLRPVPHSKVGDRVVLWGEGLPVDEVAACAGTIAYELLCRVTERIPRTAIKTSS